MRQQWSLLIVAAASIALPLSAQSPAPVKMPSGDYVIEARDTSKASAVAIVGWPFVLKGNGDFTITTPDTLTFTGKLSQQDGTATYTDQSCDTPALFTIRAERGGYAFDFKSGGCAANSTSFDKLLFKAGKPGKKP
jgi:hypothetical protein